MNTLMIIGMLGVAAGLGLVTVGVGRAVVAARTSGDVTEAILQDAPAPQVEFAQPFVVRLFGPAWELFERIARTVTPRWWLTRMRRNADLAGLGRWGIEGVLAFKGAFAAGGAALGVLSVVLLGAGVGGVIVWALLGAVLGFFAPDFLIVRRAGARQSDLRKALPETLDLMAIAVQAGMGLEGAIDLVTRRLPGSLSEEFQRMLREIQLGASRKEALQHLRERTEVSELSTFALALIQSDSLGTPLVDVLRAQSAQMRTLRRQRAREYAAKVPVKLLFPLLVGIFPALAVVIVGPAVLAIIEALF